jgi:hypothetical protein
LVKKLPLYWDAGQQNAKIPGVFNVHYRPANYINVLSKYEMPEASQALTRREEISVPQIQSV